MRAGGVRCRSVELSLVDKRAFVIPGKRSAPLEEHGGTWRVCRAGVEPHGQGGNAGRAGPADAVLPDRLELAPLQDLVANSRNPRDDVGDREDLASIADMRLQPAVAVTKASYLKLYPDDTITAKYVAVNGCRRLAAAHKYGPTDLAVVVNDEIARDRITSSPHRSVRTSTGRT